MGGCGRREEGGAAQGTTHMAAKLRVARRKAKGSCAFACAGNFLHAFGAIGSEASSFPTKSTSIAMQAALVRSPLEEVSYLARTRQKTTERQLSEALGPLLDPSDTAVDSAAEAEISGKF